MLTCEATGFAVLELSGSVHVTAMGGGNAYIHRAQTVWAHGKGRRVDWGAWTFLYDWEGQMNVSGRSFQVQLAGKHLNFTAEGRGVARLRGQGTCTVNGQVVELTPEFQEIEL